MRSAPRCRPRTATPASTSASASTPAACCSAAASTPKARIRGIAVNIAARMEQTAPPGALRISHDTYAQVRGMFEVEAQEPLTVKGVDEPIRSYLVQRAKPRAFRIGTRGIEGVATRMIGRDAELEALQRGLQRLFAERQLAAVTVVAEAGIGKSRLLYEFEAWSEARPETFYLFRGRATPQTQGQPYGLLRDILAWRFQIADDDSIEAARAKIEQGIVPLFEHDDGADLGRGPCPSAGPPDRHRLGATAATCAASSTTRGRSATARFHAAAQVFRRVARARRPRRSCCSSTTCTGPTTTALDFLAYLAEVNRDVPLLMLAFTRPTLFERRADWPGARAASQRIDLGPLGRDAQAASSPTSC